MATADSGTTPDVRAWQLQPPKQINAELVSVRYSDRLDTVFLMIDPSRPSVGLVVDDLITLRIDPETDEFLGLEISHFFSEALDESPVYAAILDVIEAPRLKVMRAKRKLQPDQRQKVVAGSVIDQIWRKFEGYGGHLPAHA